MKKSISSFLNSPVHFIGIGGCGMSALAELAVHSGLKVQGSDINDSRAVRRLKSLGVKIFSSHDEQNIDGVLSVVYSSAIKDENVELAAAKKKKIDVFHRSDFLADIIKNKTSITVAGTHGKTTTSSMIAHLLEHLDQDPSVAIGGRCISYDSSAKLGKSNFFVAEADESDGSFLKYQPDIAVLTNVAPDHMDFFRDMSHLQTTFTTYLKNVKKDGITIIGWDNQINRQIGFDLNENRLTYGFLIGSEIRAIEYNCREGVTTFKAIVERDVLPVTLNMVGKHNVLNALCALAVIRALELDVAKAAEALESYKGVARRLSTIFKNDKVSIFDDYAHNPGKISACVESIRESWPSRSITAVFQPHRYSRLETMYEDMTAAFQRADHVCVLPVFTAGETTTKDFSPEKLAEDIRINSNVSSSSHKNFDDAVRWLCGNVKEKAVVLTVGAGDVYEVGHNFAVTFSKASG